MRYTTILVAMAPLLGWAQRTDTIRYRSKAFGTERMVVIHTPQFYRYAGPEVRMPVIILLDGQHEWLVDPLLNDIEFLEFTHEVPQAITVTVPLIDRVNELAQDSVDQPTMPLLKMLTEELPPLLTPYHPSDLTVLVGHSFGASFSLYAFLRSPGSFDAILALSPLHQMETLLPQVARSLRQTEGKRVYVALGGAGSLKDGGHHDRVAPLIRALDRTGLDADFLFREYPSAGHTSLPIIAFPDLLATLFTPYSLRDSLAPVDDEYQLTSAPPSPARLLEQVDASLRFMGSSIAWDIAEINGLASRLSYSGYKDHAIAIYQRAVQLYPLLYEFQWSLGESLLEDDRTAALAHLEKALVLLDSEESDMADRDAVRKEIEALMR